MSSDRLTALQRRILHTLGSLASPGVVTGGAVLAGFYTFHRLTRDIDMFWRGRRELGTIASDVASALASATLDVHVLQRSPAFVRLTVGDGRDTCIVDLVAEPVNAIEPPVAVTVEGVCVLVDSRHEILVNKLCTLLERSEPRDLEDVRVLLESGGDLARALADAPRKDSGFSALTLAWVLRDFPLQALEDTLDLTSEGWTRLDEFRQWLVTRLIDSSRPVDPA